MVATQIVDGKLTVLNFFYAAMSFTLVNPYF